MATVKISGLSEKITDADIEKELRENYAVRSVISIERSNDGASAKVECVVSQPKLAREQIMHESSLFESDIHWAVPPPR
ncbi:MULTISPECIES: hypothetical protein [unclassified Pseudomonas]|jgi:hypothetical protein|uniref:hypothetical protein n=1 Tax=unclassified Pseudomonas TaxID=196821 RepID=UPI00111C4ECE|nr:MULTISPECIES: hypothetical protein [unclassified Pseudomonas]NKF28375.1 hypothetical protein [Pseudomonas sp. BG5]